MKVKEDQHNTACTGLRLNQHEEWEIQERLPACIMTLTLVAAGPGRVEVSQLFFYILQHPERVLFLRRGHTVGQPYGMDGHCRYTLDPSAWKTCRNLSRSVSQGCFFYFSKLVARVV